MTDAIFFVGEGAEARFLAGQHLGGLIREDGLEEGIPTSLLEVTTEEEFISGVKKHMRSVPRGQRMKKLTWAEVPGIQYIYCFFEGHVWVTNGGRWYNDYIPANIRPSRRTPSAPVNRIGKLGIDCMVQCGQCQKTERLKHKEFDAIEREELSMADVYAYFESKGWKGAKDQGWLCGECAQ